METLKISAIILISIGALIIFMIALLSKKLLKILLLNATLGIASIIIVNLTSSFTGVHIPINQWTVGSGAIFGLPAIIGLLICGILL